MRREARLLLSGDAARYAAKPDSRIPEGIEERCLDRVGRERGDAGVRIEWAAHRCDATVTGPMPTLGQPSGPIERLPWRPGTALPDRASWVSCTVTIDHGP